MHATSPHWSDIKSAMKTFAGLRKVIPHHVHAMINILLLHATKLKNFKIRWFVKFVAGL